MSLPHITTPGNGWKFQVWETFLGVVETKIDRCESGGTGQKSRSGKCGLNAYRQHGRDVYIKASELVPENKTRAGIYLHECVAQLGKSTC